MTNLLPKRNQQKLLLEYILRVAVVVLVFALLSFGVYVLSLYGARNLAQSLNDEAHSLLSETIAQDATALVEDPKRAARVAYLIEHENDISAAEVVERVSAMGGGAVAIFSVSLEKKGSEYSVII